MNEPQPDTLSHPTRLARTWRWRIAGWTVAVILALSVGVGSAFLAIQRPGSSSTVTIGPWVTDLSVGSVSANPYVRAHTALDGLFALSRREAIYFQATRDSSGRTLRAECTYQIRGSALPAAWWSITAYGPDNYLIPNTQGIYSFTNVELLPSGSSHFSFLVGGTAHPSLWLPAGESGAFSLTLRLYQPSKAAELHPERISLPSIVALGGCR